MAISSPLSRRTFLTTAAASAAVACAPRAHARSQLLPKGASRVILFQGDSITDGGRSRKNTGPNDNSALGHSYPLLLAGGLLGSVERAGWKVYNRGISGHKVPDLQARWDADTIALKPDILSILIGVNDYWHSRGGGYKGTRDEYETQFTKLLADTRTALPNVRLVVLEPFVLRCGAVDATWFPEFDERRAAAARVAEKAGATFVPLQAVFDKCAAATRPEDWIGDGVHPTLAGHGVIAEEWRKAVGMGA
jgi:lysophospholipase L1-like esterase